MTKHLGVCYTYAELDNPTEEPSVLLSPLDNDSFASLSDELLLELQQSIMAIDLDKIRQIVNKISQEDRLLARAIEQHINNFEYDRILKLLPLN